MRSENAELRRRMAAPTDPEKGEGALEVADEERVSRRALLAKAGAAVAAVAAGTLLTPREARADIFDEVLSTSWVIADTYVAALSYVEGGDGVRGFRTASGAGAVYGENPNGYGFFGTGGKAGVYGEGDDGVKGYSNRDCFSGVYGTHVGLKVGPGVTGDGKGNWPGVWGRNPEADGVTGETEGTSKFGVYGRHNGTSGFGVTGDGKGGAGAGVLGRNAAGYGGSSREARRS